MEEGKPWVPAPHVPLKAGRFVGQQERWWAVWELVGFARGRMELPDWQRLQIRLPLLLFYADGLMKARLVGLRVGHKLS